MPYEIIEFAEMVRNVVLVVFVGGTIGFAIVTVAVLAYWLVDGILFVLLCAALAIWEFVEWKLFE